MVGLLEHGLGHQRRRAHAFERRDPAGAPGRPVHAARIELHDAVGVGQAAEADAAVGRVELAVVDAGDQRIEHVGAPGDQVERLLDAGFGAAVLVDVAVVRRHDHRLHAVGLHRRRLPEYRRGCAADRHTNSRTRLDEFATSDCFRHA